MEVIKRNQLSEALKTQNYRIICESVKEKRIAKENKHYDIFLCHSTKDQEEIRALKAFYENQDKSAYVAEIDDPQISLDGVNKSTAEILQNRMQNSDKLYYVLSRNSQISKWMPWELGFFDGKKGSYKIKVVPIVDKNDYEVFSFPGQEYLELYTDSRTIKTLRLQETLDKAWT